MNSILEIFLKNITNNENKIAISYDNKKLTYAELLNISTNIYLNLNKIGVKNGDVIGLNVRKDIYYVPLVFAIWNNGCSFVPIDEELPNARKKYMIGNSNLKILITENKYDIDKDITCNIISKDRLLIPNVIDIDYSIISDKAIKNDDVAYIIYTSGTTGKPKGVIINNNNLHNFIDSFIEELNLDNMIKLLSISNIGFDMSIFDLLLPLSVGGELHIASKRCLIDMDLLEKTILDENINFMQATPITWKMLINNNWKNKNHINIGCAGEILQTELCEKLLKVSNGFIYNLYGPTEATVYTSVGKIFNKDDISIGKPISNMEYYVLNEKLEKVGENEKGELFLAGKNLSIGYINNSEMTNKKFLSNKFSPKYKIMYATGDIVYKKCMNYYYIGRKDSQIKLNGHRIELEEIESVIQNIIPNNVAVILKNNQLCAYIEGNDDINIECIVNELEEYLPAYMIPHNYKTINIIPLTYNKKIDRKKLIEL